MAGEVTSRLLNAQECANVLAENLSKYVLRELKKNPENSKDVGLALQRAFVEMDSDILNGGFEDQGSAIRPAMAGSCALVALIQDDDLYVACTGDSRAVLVRKSNGFHLLSCN